ncbi:hypothetical protein LEMLEM_LOCUS7655 [Lemmus lemmus]
MLMQTCSDGRDCLASIGRTSASQMIGACPRSHPGLMSWERSRKA